MPHRFSSILENHRAFEDNINELLNYGNEIIFHNSRTDKEKVLIIESLVLRSCAYWEKFLENEIVEAISLDYNKFITNIGLASQTKLTKKLVRVIIFSNYYFDFHNTNQVVSYFNENMKDELNPIKNLSKENKDKIDFTYKIRNYISHFSDFARKRLFKEMKKNGIVKTKFIEPGLVLIKNNGDVFHEYINNFVTSSIKMRKIFQ